MILNFWFIFSLQSILAFSEVCYQNLGCFNKSNIAGKSLERYLLPLPNHPNQIDTKFYLFNRKINESEILQLDSITENYLINTSTKVIIHGFLQNSTKPWLIDMKNELLKNENLNVIVVDWSKGSRFPYEQSVSNALVVGAEIARLINSLINLNKTSAEQFHLIGMSLGAHIAGYTGKRVIGLGRISGLDPAGPYFENAEDEIRLTASDANFVDVIHTDIPSYLNFGFGISKSIGDVDFYVNGGFDQPQCAKKSEQLTAIFFILAMKHLQKVKHLITCSHLSVIDYYIDSIRGLCQYTAFKCNSKNDFDSGKCFVCPTNGCNQMGYWASPDKELGNLYLSTKSASEKVNLCKRSYLITLKSIDNLDKEIQANGIFSIIFESANKNSTQEIFDDSKVVFESNSVETRLISTSNIEEIKKLYIIYQKTTSLISWIYEDSWKFEYVKMMDNVGLSKKFCPIFEDTKDHAKITKFIIC